LEPEETSTLSRVSENSLSLKTTVPISIVKLFKLKDKDKLRWEIRAENNNLLIIVSPAKKR
jgi:hypothetical protein